MRISDWSSDVCSSDLHAIGALDGSGELAQRLTHQASLQARQGIAHFAFDFGLGNQSGHRVEIGRASCRERVCQYVYISVVAVSLKKKSTKTLTTQNEPNT